MASRLLGQQASLKRAESLMLAGLLQDIGRLALLQATPEEYSLLCADADDNAALLAASILGHQHPQFHAALKQFRTEQTETVLENPDPRS